MSVVTMSDTSAYATTLSSANAATMSSAAKSTISVSVKSVKTADRISIHTTDKTPGNTTNVAPKTYAPHTTFLASPTEPNNGWPTTTTWMREYKRRSKFLYISHLPASAIAGWQYVFLRDTLLQFPLCTVHKDNGVVNTCHFLYNDGKAQTVLVEYGDWREAKAALGLLPGVLEAAFPGVGVFNLAQGTGRQQEGLMGKWDKRFESGEAAKGEQLWRRAQQGEVQRVRGLAAQWAAEDAVAKAA